MPTEVNADIYQHSSKMVRLKAKKSSIKRSVYLHEVASEIGVAAITLRRWLLAGKIPEVSRNRNGWRVFTPRDVVAIRKFANRRDVPKTK